jgi:hypothetical protein
MPICDSFSMRQRNRAEHNRITHGILLRLIPIDAMAARGEHAAFFAPPPGPFHSHQ